MIFTALDNFYLSEEELENCPSRQHGVSQDVERGQRIYGCELIQEAAILLRLPQAVMATGQVLLHRFYCKHSLVEHDIKRAAIACVWLATKLEETPRYLRQVLPVFYRMDRRRRGKSLVPLDVNGMDYAKQKADAVNMERIILRAFGFILHVEHPHKFILNYLTILEQDKDPEKGLLQRAWNLANDSLRTTLCVRYKAETVACGLIFMAARQLKVPLPENPAWWDLFSVKKSELLDVAVAVADLYTLPKAEYAPISQHALREQRHAATRQPAASASPLPEHVKSPLSGTADMTNGAAPQAAEADGAGGNSDERPTSAGHAASTAQQTNGHVKDDQSETSKGDKDQSPRRKQARSRSRSRSRSVSRSRSPPRGQEKASRHQEGYRDKHRHRAESSVRDRAQEPDAKKHRVIQYDPRGDARHSGHSRERDRHRSSSHVSKHRRREDSVYSRDHADRKRRRDRYDSPEG